MSTLPSWPALKAEVEALTRTLAEAVEAFLTASVSGRIGRAGQFLAQHPGISGHDFGPRSRWVTPPASMLSQNAIRVWLPGGILAPGGRRSILPARRAGMSTRSAPRGSWRSWACCWMQAPTCTVCRPMSRSGRRCAARSRAPARVAGTSRSCGCCSNAAPRWQIMTCTWPGSRPHRGTRPPGDAGRPVSSGACGCWSSTPRTCGRSPRRRSRLRSRSTTLTGCGCCWTPAQTPAGTATTTTSPSASCWRRSGPTAASS